MRPDAAPIPVRWLHVLSCSLSREHECTLSAHAPAALSQGVCGRGGNGCSPPAAEASWTQERELRPAAAVRSASAAALVAPLPLRAGPSRRQGRRPRRHVRGGGGGLAAAQGCGAAPRLSSGHKRLRLRRLGPGSSKARCLCDPLHAEVLRPPSPKEIDVHLVWHGPAPRLRRTFPTVRKAGGGTPPRTEAAAEWRLRRSS